VRSPEDPPSEGRVGGAGVKVAEWGRLVRGGEEGGWERGEGLRRRGMEKKCGEVGGRRIFRRGGRK